jgi:hypothetical protein
MKRRETLSKMIYGDREDMLSAKYTFDVAKYKNVNVAKYVRDSINDLVKCDLTQSKYAIY